MATVDVKKKFYLREIKEKRKIVTQKKRFYAEKKYFYYTKKGILHAEKKVLSFWKSEEKKRKKKYFYPPWGKGHFLKSIINAVVPLGFSNDGFQIFLREWNSLNWVSKYQISFEFTQKLIDSRILLWKLMGSITLLWKFMGFMKPIELMPQLHTCKWRLHYWAS